MDYKFNEDKSSYEDVDFFFCSALLILLQPQKWIVQDEINVIGFFLYVNLPFVEMPIVANDGINDFFQDQWHHHSKNLDNECKEKDYQYKQLGTDARF